MKDKIKLPVALQIVADDFGWHNGRDGRCENRPSRSGLPRDHAPEDCIIMNEIGKALDMKILMPFVIGEWDKDNILRGVKNVTYNEKGWDRASEINMKVAEKYFEAAESSDYIEYGYHALLHCYYKDNKQISETEYSRPVYDEKTNTFDYNTFKYIPRDEMQSYIDLFFRIYDSWGFKKKIRAFVSPCSIHTPREETGEFAKVLRDNGFIHWANYWGKLNDNAAVIEGVTFIQKSFVGASWEMYDVDPLMLTDQKSEHSAIGFHWTNFLRLNPENNLERLSDWIKYFRRQGTIFGQMLSKDIAFATSQAVYQKYAKLSFEEDKCLIDLEDVEAQNALALKDEFYLSSQIPLDMASCTGGIMSLYETNTFPFHNTYKIKRTGGNVVTVCVKK